jgi:hypothetical protein
MDVGGSARSAGKYPDPFLILRSPAREAQLNLRRPAVISLIPGETGAAQALGRCDRKIAIHILGKEEEEEKRPRKDLLIELRRNPLLPGGPRQHEFTI